MARRTNMYNSNKLHLRENDNFLYNERMNTSQEYMNNNETMSSECTGYSDNGTIKPTTTIINICTKNEMAAPATYQEIKTDNKNLLHQVMEKIGDAYKEYGTKHHKIQNKENQNRVDLNKNRNEYMNVNPTDQIKYRRRTPGETKRKSDFRSINLKPFVRCQNKDGPTGKPKPRIVVSNKSPIMHLRDPSTVAPAYNAYSAPLTRSQTMPYPNKTHMMENVHAMPAPCVYGSNMRNVPRVNWESQTENRNIREYGIVDNSRNDSNITFGTRNGRRNSLFTTSNTTKRTKTAPVIPKQNTSEIYNDSHSNNIVLRITSTKEKKERKSQKQQSRNSKVHSKNLYETNEFSCPKNVKVHLKNTKSIPSSLKRRSMHDTQEMYHTEQNNRFPEVAEEDMQPYDPTTMKKNARAHIKTRDNTSDVYNKQCAEATTQKQTIPTQSNRSYVNQKTKDVSTGRFQTERNSAQTIASESNYERMNDEMNNSKEEEYVYNTEKPTENNQNSVESYYNRDDARRSKCTLAKTDLEPTKSSRNYSEKVVSSEDSISEYNNSINSKAKYANIPRSSKQNNLEMTSAENTCRDTSESLQSLNSLKRSKTPSSKVTGTKSIIVSSHNEITEEALENGTCSKRSQRTNVTNGSKYNTKESIGRSNKAPKYSQSNMIMDKLSSESIKKLHGESTCSFTNHKTKSKVTNTLSRKSGSKQSNDSMKNSSKISQIDRRSLRSLQEKQWSKCSRESAKQLKNSISRPKNDSSNGSVHNTEMDTCRSSIISSNAKSSKKALMNGTYESMGNNIEIIEEMGETSSADFQIDNIDQYRPYANLKTLEIRETHEKKQYSDKEPMNSDLNRYSPIALKDVSHRFLNGSNQSKNGSVAHQTMEQTVEEASNLLMNSSQNSLNILNSSEDFEIKSTDQNRQFQMHPSHNYMKSYNENRNASNISQVRNNNSKYTMGYSEDENDVVSNAYKTKSSKRTNQKTESDPSIRTRDTHKNGGAIRSSSYVSATAASMRNNKTFNEDRDQRRSNELTSLTSNQRMSQMKGSYKTNENRLSNSAYNQNYDSDKSKKGSREKSLYKGSNKNSNVSLNRDSSKYMKSDLSRKELMNYKKDTAYTSNSRCIVDKSRTSMKQLSNDNSSRSRRKSSVHPSINNIESYEDNVSTISRNTQNRSRRNEKSQRSVSGIGRSELNYANNSGITEMRTTGNFLEEDSLYNEQNKCIRSYEQPDLGAGFGALDIDNSVSRRKSTLDRHRSEKFQSSNSSNPNKMKKSHTVANDSRYDNGYDNSSQSISKLNTHSFGNRSFQTKNKSNDKYNDSSISRMNSHATKTNDNRNSSKRESVYNTEPMNYFNDMNNTKEQSINGTGRSKMINSSNYEKYNSYQPSSNKYLCDGTVENSAMFSKKPTVNCSVDDMNQYESYPISHSPSKSVRPISEHISRNNDITSRKSSVANRNTIQKTQSNYENRYGSYQQSRNTPSIRKHHTDMPLHMSKQEISDFEEQEQEIYPNESKSNRKSSRKPTHKTSQRTHRTNNESVCDMYENDPQNMDTLKALHQATPSHSYRKSSKVSKPVSYNNDYVSPSQHRTDNMISSKKYSSIKNEVPIMYESSEMEGQNTMEERYEIESCNYRMSDKHNDSLVKESRSNINTSYNGISESRKEQPICRLNNSLFNSASKQTTTCKDNSNRETVTTSNKFNTTFSKRPISRKNISEPSKKEYESSISMNDSMATSDTYTDDRKNNYDLFYVEKLPHKQKLDSIIKKVIGSKWIHNKDTDKKKKSEEKSKSRQRSKYSSEKKQNQTEEMIDNAWVPTPNENEMHETLNASESEIDGYSFNKSKNQTNLYSKGKSMQVSSKKNTIADKTKSISCNPIMYGASAQQNNYSEAFNSFFDINDNRVPRELVASKNKIKTDSFDTSVLSDYESNTPYDNAEYSAYQTGDNTYMNSMQETNGIQKSESNMNNSFRANISPQFPKTTVRDNSEYSRMNDNETMSITEKNSKGTRSMNTRSNSNIKGTHTDMTFSNTNNPTTQNYTNINGSYIDAPLDSSNIYSRSSVLSEGMNRVSNERSMYEPYSDEFINHRSDSNIKNNTSIGNLTENREIEMQGISQSYLDNEGQMNSKSMDITQGTLNNSNSMYTSNNCMNNSSHNDYYLSDSQKNTESFKITPSYKSKNSTKEYIPTPAVSHGNNTSERLANSSSYMNNNSVENTSGLYSHMESNNQEQQLSHESISRKGNNVSSENGYPTNGTILSLEKANEYLQNHFDQSQDNFSSDLKTNTINNNSISNMALNGSFIPLGNTTKENTSTLGSSYKVMESNAYGSNDLDKLSNFNTNQYAPTDSMQKSNGPLSNSNEFNRNSSMNVSQNRPYAHEETMNTVYGMGERNQSNTNEINNSMQKSQTNSYMNITDSNTMKQNSQMISHMNTNGPSSSTFNSAPNGFIQMNPLVNAMSNAQNSVNSNNSQSPVYSQYNSGNTISGNTQGMNVQQSTNNMISNKSASNSNLAVPYLFSPHTAVQSDGINRSMSQNFPSFQNSNYRSMQSELNTININSSKSGIPLLEDTLSKGSLELNSGGNIIKCNVPNEQNFSTLVKQLNLKSINKDSQDFLNVTNSKPQITVSNENLINKCSLVSKSETQLPLNVYNSRNNYQLSNLSLMNRSMGTNGTNDTVSDHISIRPTQSNIISQVNNRGPSPFSQADRPVQMNSSYLVMDGMKRTTSINPIYNGFTHSSQDRNDKQTERSNQGVIHYRNNQPSMQNGSVILNNSVSKYSIPNAPSRSSVMNSEYIPTSTSSSSYTNVNSSNVQNQGPLYYVNSTPTLSRNQSVTNYVSNLTSSDKFYR